MVGGTRLRPRSALGYAEARWTRTSDLLGVNQALQAQNQAIVTGFVTVVP